MSYDPYAYGADVPPEPGPGTGDAAAGADAYAYSRVQAPAIALIVVGVLNLLVALLQVIATLWILVQPAEAARKQQEEMLGQLEKSGLLPPDFSKQVQKQQAQKTPEEEKTSSVIQNAVGSVLMMAIAILTMLAGFRMRSLRSYALSMVGAISAAIPCLSCGGCCGFGEIVGIWALIVLLNEQVKAAFR
jgi:hypothetical protein